LAPPCLAGDDGRQRRHCPRDAAGRRLGRAGRRTLAGLLAETGNQLSRYAMRRRGEREREPLGKIPGHLPTCLGGSFTTWTASGDSHTPARQLRGRHWRGGLETSEQGMQRLGLDRLDKMVVEAGRLTAAPVLLLTPSC